MNKQKTWKCSACGAELPDLPMIVFRHQLSHVERRGLAKNWSAPDAPPAEEEQPQP
jgi:hypothetical protein